ncbi:MAG: hypothetical protein DMD43_08655 [Gemmatimonadetes bacterium]|nr:MAG: hypothetical protein DMD43_08655 [Gemmatimonadota bacterium]
MGDLRERLQQTLGAGYTIERELPAGGMSRVFVATESRLGRQVVVKVLRPEVAAGTSAERFEREMALCARCHHPHIVPLLTAGEVADLPYFTMPLVEGESLRDLLARGARLPVGEVIRLLGEVADALAYAHRQGVVHRDIKPENILLQDGHAVVADFGVAKALHAATRSELPPETTAIGMIIGTPVYMSPEQALGDPAVDHRADLYALGVVAYELLTGKPPFTLGRIPSLAAAHEGATPTPVERTRSDCPAALAGLINRLLAKDPDRRPQSAEEVVEALRRIGAAGGVWRESRVRALLVRTAVAVAVVAAVGFGLARVRSRPAGSGLGASVAVLPFANIGGDSTTNYFSDGLAEELISALGRLGGLRVASRTSAFAARGSGADLPGIGRRLGVGAVLEGSVRRDGPRVRVTARLVDVAHDAQLWTGEYESRLENVFAVQDTIARAIAGALRVTLTGAPGGSLVERGTGDPEAHDLYLRGRYFLALRTGAALEKSIEAFQAAVARDSTYALAWAGLGDAYSLAVPFGGLTPREALPKGKAAALRALALDSTLSEVHTSLGLIAMFYDLDLSDAERRLTRAVALNPSSAEARLFHSWSLLLSGRGPDAMAEIERARALDPFSRIINTRIGSFLHFLGRDAEAIPAFRRALEIDSTFVQARAGLALSYAMLGRFREALAIPLPVAPMYGNFESGEPGVIMAMAGKRDEARRMLAQLERARKDRYVSSEGLAVIHAALGEVDQAFAELERAASDRAFTMAIARVEPMYAPLHADPRWGRLMARLNFPPTASR